MFDSGALTGRRMLIGWAGQAPSLDVVRAFESAQPASAFDCVEAKRELALRGGKLRANSSAPIPIGETVARIGLPVISADGTEALALVATRLGGLGGSDLLLYLSKPSRGAWQVVGVNLLGSS